MDCPKCNNPATFGPNEGFYGTRYVSSAGSYMAWYCKRCSTYVGTHHNDPAKPLGTMADAETREWRARAHRVIDPIWQSGRTQAAPGPNILFVALMGWNVGLNAGGLGLALLGVVVSMLGVMLPSSTLAYFAARWGHENRDLRSVRAFKQGMAPVVIALLIATGWILASAHGDPAQDWPLWLLTVVTALIVWRTRLHLLWLLGAGAVLGWFGLV